MSNEKLEQTKGKIKISGRVKGIGNENARREGFTKSEKQYKSLQFFVETSPINTIRVELFGMERDQVAAYSSKAKETKKINWADRDKDHGDYKVLGVNCYLEDDPNDDNKKQRKVFVEYDAIDYIAQNIKDGDFVRINGAIDFSHYENKQGEEVEQKRFVINSISKLNEAIDFNSPDFKEEAKFEHDIVISDVMMDDEAKRLYVSAKIIKYGGDIEDTTFTVDTERYPKLATNMTKRFNFGDFITVYGLIINSVIEEKVEDVVDQADEDDWGGDESIKDEFDTTYIREYISELQIISVDSSSYEPKKYKEEDLLSEDEDAFNGDIQNEDEGDDFDDDDDDMDDLPFE